MASEKVFGIAESKSKVEVPRKSDVYTKDETYSKTEVYPKANTYSSSYINATFLKKEDGAPKNHAAGDSTYGLGTADSFGHCKLTSSLSAPSGDQDGIALAGSVGYLLKTYIDTQIAILQMQIHMIPIGGVYWSFNPTSGSAIAQALGYGTWEYCGVVNYNAIPSGQEQSSVWAYRRVS